MGLDNEKNEKELIVAKSAAIDSEIGNLGKGSFIAALSHELRIPMNSIMGMLRLLSETDLTAKQEGYVSSALEASDFMLSWIKEITRFSSTDADEFCIEDFPFDLFRAGRDVVKVFSGEVSSKKINLQYQYDSDTPTLFNGDVLKIQQVLAKLIENGIRFTEQGSVKLQISSRSKNEEVSVIEFTVSDTGVGISPQKLVKIFDFTDDEIATNPMFRKISLELAVCEKIITAMNGSIEFKSEKDEGTEVVIQIPLPETSDKMIEAMATEAEDLLDISTSKVKIYTGIKVLLAEDDPINQSLAVAFLNKLGGEIDTADNGKEAVEKYKTGSYNIIFMDCEMPEMDGYEATRTIRELEAESGKHTPILAMTAYAGRGDREYCLAAGMDDHIPKPITIDVLEDVIHKFIIPDLAK